MWLILAAVVGMLVPGRLLFFVGLPIVATVREGTRGSAVEF